MLVDSGLAELVWRGVEDANPWWRTGRVPSQRTASYRREAFGAIYGALTDAEQGRGVVVLGPRRVGKTVLVHQVVEQLLADGRTPHDVCLLPLDDVALRDRDLGELLQLVDVRLPPAQQTRVLVLDEVQHSPEWARWLKRIADRRDPYVFLATGSSATALRRGGQDQGLGRWQEMVLFPWSFREHVELRGLKQWSFELTDFKLEAAGLNRPIGKPPPDEADRIDSALIDYFLRGGFPEAAQATDLTEARRRLRQDILDRALGRDVLDVVNVDARVLERMFLRICMNPGGLWSETEVANDLGITRPTVGKYLRILEQAFLVLRLENLASPVRGQPKVYLVAPALRQALLALDESHVREPHQWGQLAENAVVAAAVGARPPGAQLGFWRKGSAECDLIALNVEAPSEYIEVRRSGRKAIGGIRTAAAALKREGLGFVLSRDWKWDMTDLPDNPATSVFHQPLAVWLYGQRTIGAPRLAR